MNLFTFIPYFRLGGKQSQPPLSIPPIGPQGIRCFKFNRGSEKEWDFRGCCKQLQRATTI